MKWNEITWNSMHTKDTFLFSFCRPKRLNRAETCYATNGRKNHFDQKRPWDEQYPLTARQVHIAPCTSLCNSENSTVSLGKESGKPCRLQLTPPLGSISCKICLFGAKCGDMNTQMVCSSIVLSRSTYQSTLQKSSSRRSNVWRSTHWKYPENVESIKKLLDGKSGLPRARKMFGWENTLIARIEKAQSEGSRFTRNRKR